MIELHREAEPSKALARNYDYVIVGAGSAGCVVARRLLDGTDATVLLLEAGGPVEDIKSLSLEFFQPLLLQMRKMRQANFSLKE